MRHCNIQYHYLHSNMVRFIIFFAPNTVLVIKLFTFQYGQIYYKDNIYQITSFTKSFTFQYGQIYYTIQLFPNLQRVFIYIPIWLDLLLMQREDNAVQRRNLHSNMVRFIIRDLIAFLLYSITFTFQYGQIYYLQNTKWTEYL